MHKKLSPHTSPRSHRLRACAGRASSASLLRWQRSTTNPTRTIAYDAAGNITKITGATASAYTTTYNLAGRLTTLTKSGVTTTYAYDSSGRRIRKFISAGTGAGAASTVLFAYDQDDHLLGEYDSTGTPIREYLLVEVLTVAPMRQWPPHHLVC